MNLEDVAAREIGETMARCLDPFDAVTRACILELMQLAFVRGATWHCEQESRAAVVAEDSLWVCRAIRNSLACTKHEHSAAEILSEDGIIMERLRYVMRKVDS